MRSRAQPQSARHVVDGTAAILRDLLGDLSGRLLNGAVGAQASAGRVQRAMNRFFEYVVHHPFLVAAAAILAVLAAVIEFRQRARGSSAVAPADAVRLANAGALLLDVRNGEEYEAGHIIEARHLPAAELAAKAETLKKYKGKPVVVYCDSGTASGAAARTLRASGFNKVVTLRGGLQSWRQENLPLVKGAVRKDGKHA